MPAHTRLSASRRPGEIGYSRFGTHVDAHLINSVPQISRWIPVRHNRLCAPASVAPSREHNEGAGMRRRPTELETPPRIECTLIAQPCRRPSTATVGRDIDPINLGIPDPSETADLYCLIRNGRARDERSYERFYGQFLDRHHIGGRDKGAGTHRVYRATIAALHKRAIMILTADRDVRQPLDGIGALPPCYNRPKGKPMCDRQCFPVHAERNESCGVEGLVDG